MLIFLDCINFINLFDEMMEFVDDVVDTLDSRKQIENLRKIINKGTSADRQIEIYNQRKNINDVVDNLIKETMEGC